MSCDCLFKFITVGDSAVGKSCLMTRFTEKSFPTGGHEPTIGTGFGNRTVTINRKKVKLHIWDTAGQEKFRSITRSYFRNAAAALLVYDITRRETFVRLASWLKDIQEQAAFDTKIMLVGNKSDLEKKREVSTEEASEFALVNGLMFVECSARTGDNVEAAFVQTATAILESIRHVESDEEELKQRGVKVFPSRDALTTIYGIISPICGGSSCCYKS